MNKSQSLLVETHRFPKFLKNPKLAAILPIHEQIKHKVRINGKLNKHDPT